jgi:hypothetical protein
VSAGVCVATRVKRHSSAQVSSWDGWVLTDVGKEAVKLYYA